MINEEGGITNLKNITGGNLGFGLTFWGLSCYLLYNLSVVIQQIAKGLRLLKLSD